ncbi:hypothetical protein F1880_007386 [Penicillium rolfsii]|nr:hypothetical protein F1880_007386 [Penicillium rolfsii]
MEDTEPKEQPGGASRRETSFSRCTRSLDVEVEDSSSIGSEGTSRIGDAASWKDEDFSKSASR